MKNGNVNEKSISKTSSKPDLKTDFLVEEYKKLWASWGIEAKIPRGAKLRKKLSEKTLPKTLEEVREMMGDGCGCALCPTKIKLVFGTGNPKADLMFVGEGPGADEDAQGEPFVGRAGQLLNKIIEAMGLSRTDVYIANIVKCRPPSNRVPLPEEIQSCLPYLKMQIALIQPKWIITLGATATTTLTETQSPMSQLRGRFHTLGWNPRIQVLPTYHPAYLLRNPSAKKLVWDDVQLVMEKMRAS
jgi:DNA polymerase